MRTVGDRKMPQIAFSASAEALVAGSRFNDSMHGLSPAQGYIPKGVYFFKTHEEANQFDLRCLAEKMAEIATQRGRL